MKRLIPLLVSLICFLACVKTPKVQPAIPAYGAFEEKANIEAEGEQELLSNAFETHLNKQYTLEHGWEILINAELDIPKVQQIPLVRVRACALSDQELQTILGIFRKDKEIYDATNGIPKTKEESVAIIGRIQQRIDTLEAQGELDELDGLRNTLDYELAHYNELPSQQELVLQKVDPTSIQKTCFLAMSSDRFGWAKYLVRDEREEGLYDVLFTDYGWNGCYYYFEDAEEEFRPQTDKPSFDEKEAMEKAQAIIDALGLDSMKLSKISIGYATDFDTDEISDVAGCYAFQFTRSIGDIQQPSSGGYAWYEQFSQEGTVEYSIPWETEYICIEVDEKGVASFQWHNPVEIMETMNSNVKVLPLEAALASFDVIMDRIYPYYVICCANIIHAFPVSRKCRCADKLVNFS